MESLRVQNTFTQGHLASVEAANETEKRFPHESSQQLLWMSVAAKPCNLLAALKDFNEIPPKCVLKELVPYTPLGSFDLYPSSFVS